MENTELMTTEATEATEMNYDSYESDSSKSSILPKLGGLALVGAAAVGTVAILKKKGIIKSKEQKAIDELTKRGYVISAPVVEEADVVIEEVPVEEETASKKKSK